MSENQSLPPLLLGLFRELLANNVPLGLRDYIEGLRALQLGFGSGDRQQVCKLAQILWARSNDERRLIARYLGEIPSPHEEITSTLEDVIRITEKKSVLGDIKPKSSEIGDSPNLTSTDFSNTNVTKTQTSSEQSNHRARVSFSEISGTDGLPLPYLDATPCIEEVYTLHPQTLFKSRDLAVLWRRFRRATRQGPRVELDISATIRKRCLDGVLREPVLRSRRINSARLLVLADVSPSMAPWYPFLSTLEESLHFSQFDRTEIRYFNNLPRKQLFSTIELSKPQPLSDVFRRYVGSSLMVISDAGSARGYLNRRRAAQADNFLKVAKHQCRNIVWLNPMPSDRWSGTTAGLLAGNINMLPLDPKHMLSAIDILRGNK